VCLRAQGFGKARPAGKIGPAAIKKVLASTAMLQMDSVNVAVRAHYMPIFSRLGPYDAGLLDRMAYERRDLFEFWAHEACLIPMPSFPLHRWRMRKNETDPLWVERYVGSNSAYIEAVYKEVLSRGPVSASELSDPGERRGKWWGWGDGKRALEWLFRTGRLTTSHRRNFERVYDVMERVIPKEILDAPEVAEDEAKRQLLTIAARSLGVATAKDLADYFRLRTTILKPRLKEIIEAGDVIEVRVEGAKVPWYMDAGARIPRDVPGAALVTPFDPLIWERSRVESLFGMRYRIEIYVPAPQRTYGYYVMPFLLGDDLAARVDLKADRKARRLLVQGSFLEPGRRRAEVSSALATELELMAGWLGLEDVEVRPNGDLAPALARAVKGRGRR